MPNLQSEELEPPGEDAPLPPPLTDRLLRQRRRVWRLRLTLVLLVWLGVGAVYYADPAVFLIFAVISGPILIYVGGDSHSAAGERAANWRPFTAILCLVLFASLYPIALISEVINRSGGQAPVAVMGLFAAVGVLAFLGLWVLSGQFGGGTGPSGG